MTELILGVVDIPYDDGGKAPPRRVPKKPRKGKAARKAPPTRKGSTQTTTVQVATILEEKYNVMGTFVDQHHDDIVNALIHSVEGALEDIFAGSPVSNPFAEAAQEIDAGFRIWLQSGEIEQLGIEGVPTQAAIERRSLRFKSKKANGPRPSFIDTGTYELAFRSSVNP